MKFKLSKSLWEKIGQENKWIKVQQNMTMNLNIELPFIAIEHANGEGDIDIFCQYLSKLNKENINIMYSPIDPLSINFPSAPSAASKVFVIHASEQDTHFPPGQLNNMKQIRF